MTKWEIDAGRGFGIGIGLMSFITLANAALIGIAATQPITFGTFVVGVSVLFGFLLVGLIAYWVYGLAGGSYTLDRNALTIQWGTSKQVIPTNEIERVFTGDEVEGGIRFYGGGWPGHWVGYGEIRGAGETLFYATDPPRQQIFVATPGLVYGISPAEREAFLESLHKRMQMGPTQPVDPASRRPAILEWSIWRDPLALILLAAGALAFAALLGYVCFRFPSLPVLVPLRFGASGSPSRLGPRAEIFLIPLIGLVTLLINGPLGGLLYRRDRVASYLLWAGSILVQLLVWGAAVGLLVHTV
ncbi:MAG: PH domain-containing protein [Chloroflexota bacterium]